MAARNSSKTVVYAALAGNLLVALTKSVAASWTGSASMMSEAVHSFVDTGNELLLLYGMRQSARRPDPAHPLGYGRELYFWSFIVALLIFALGAGVSVYQGVRHLREPESIADPLVNYVVLGFACVFEGSSWLISLRQFRAAKGDIGYFEAFQRSKDPPSFMVLFEDSAALVGIAFAALGTFGATSLGFARADGLASIAIGLVLAGVAILLARESKSLLIGERADPKLVDAILRIASTEPGITSANGVLTTQLAPDQIVVALSVDFDDTLTAHEVESCVQEIERKVRAAYPKVKALFVKPQTGTVYRDAVRRRYGMRQLSSGAGQTRELQPPPGTP